jgi:hypothetical protein
MIESENWKENSMEYDYKSILRNLYLMTEHHAQMNRMNANDLIRAERYPHFHWQDKGLADAYEGIRFFLLRPELLENLDYNKIMKENTSVPNWLQD